MIWTSTRTRNCSSSVSNTRHLIFCDSVSCKQYGKMASNKSHLPSFITAKDRALQYPSVLHESAGKLFCTPCNKVLDHRRKSSINYHLQGQKHLKAVERNRSRQQRQITMAEIQTRTTVAALERIKVRNHVIRVIY